MTETCEGCGAGLNTYKGKVYCEYCNHYPDPREADRKVAKAFRNYPFHYECWNCNNVYGSEKSLRIKKTRKNIFLSDKSFILTLLLCIFLGMYGGHRFYTSKTSTAILMLFTFGGFGIWWIIDFLILITGNLQDDDELFITPPWYTCCPKCSCLNIRLKKI